MAARGENCNDWPRTVMTGGCLLVAFGPDGATDNDDDDGYMTGFFIFASNQFFHRRNILLSRSTATGF